MAEYARHRGVTRQAVSKLVKAGKIPTTSDGKIIPADADFALGQNRERVIAGRPPVGAVDDEGDEGGREAGAGLTKARTAGALYDARLKRLTFEQRLGKLVETDAVVKATERLAEALLRVIDRIPMHADELAAACAKDGAIGARRVLRDLQRDLRNTAAEEFSKLPAEVIATAGQAVAAADDEGTPE